LISHVIAYVRRKVFEAHSRSSIGEKSLRGGSAEEGACGADPNLIENMLPLPKAPPRKASQKGRRRGECAILKGTVTSIDRKTSLPNKIFCEVE
jgi:hypothetical protein